MEFKAGILLPVRGDHSGNVRIRNQMLIQHLASTNSREYELNAQYTLELVAAVMLHRKRAGDREIARLNQTVESRLNRRLY